MEHTAPPDRIDRAKRVLESYLRERGLRVTRQRVAILEAFLAEDGHVSVEELYARIRQDHPTIGYATVYRSMALFARAGIAKERRFHEGRVRYEAGIGVDHHDHLVCLHCGQILEFEEPRIERLQEEIARSRGFRVAFHRLELYGLCPRCQGDEKFFEKGVDTTGERGYK